MINSNISSLFIPLETKFVFLNCFVPTETLCDPLPLGGTSCAPSVALCVTNKELSQKNTEKHRGTQRRNQ
jgi:hypothetical protein